MRLFIFSSKVEVGLAIGPIGLIGPIFNGLIGLSGLIFNRPYRSNRSYRSYLIQSS